MIKGKVVCPWCEREFFLHEARCDEDLRQIAELAGRLGWGFKAAEAYLECFKRAEHRPLRPKVALRLLEELARMWESETVTFGGKEHRVDRQVLKAAMERVAGYQKRGLQNHNYLKKVAIEMQRQLDARREQELRRREEALRQRLDPSQAKRGLKRLKEIIDGAH